MEESLREAACVGDLAAVTKLIEAGVNVNSANKINGWTSLHWACRRGHLVIIKLLLRYGADVNLLTHKGESPVDLALNREVLELIAPNGNLPVKAIESLPIIPHYLEHQEFPYSKRREETLNNELLSQGMECDTYSAGYKRKMVEQHDIEQVSKRMNNNDNVLMVKCRIAGHEDLDFIEVEVTPVTFTNLLHSCCEELQINSDHVTKLRKLPNVVIRNDKDVLRLVPNQEIEVVLK